MKLKSASRVLAALVCAAGVGAAAVAGAETAGADPGPGTKIVINGQERPDVDRVILREDIERELPGCRDPPVRYATPRVPGRVRRGSTPVPGWERRYAQCNPSSRESRIGVRRVSARRTADTGMRRRWSASGSTAMPSVELLA